MASSPQKLCSIGFGGENKLLATGSSSSMSSLCSSEVAQRYSVSCLNTSFALSLLPLAADLKILSPLTVGILPKLKVFTFS